MNKIKQRGFATILALLVIALLVVVLVGAAIFVRVETLTSSNAKKAAEARRNAIFGLENAITLLQETAGPDQRVTAPAELNRNTSTSTWEPAFLPGASTNAAAQTPSRNWSGVWDVSRNRYIPDSAKPGRVVSNVGSSASQVSPEPLAWLISGGRRKNGGAESQTNNVTPLSYPARLTSAGKITGVADIDAHVVLLGSGSVDLAGDQAEGVVVPKVPIWNPASSQPGVAAGAYAFWIGDEGTKAKFQAGAEFSSLGHTFSGASLDQVRLASSQKLGIGTVEGTATNHDLATDGYDPSDPGFAASLLRLSADSQVNYLPDGDKLGADFKRRFHDLTLYAKGVLADVKKGGLKEDLSVYLGNGNISGYISDTDLLYEDPRDAGTAADDPRSPFRTRFPGFHPTSNSNLPRMGILRTWNGIDISNPQITPRTDTQHGLFPVITRCEWPAWLHFDLPTASAYPQTIPANSGQVRLRFHPVITLYNPYNVRLPGVSYIIRIRVDNDALFELLADPPNTVNVGGVMKFDVNASLLAANTATHDSAIYLRIPASESSLPPGASKVFTLQNSGAIQQVMDMVCEFSQVNQQFGDKTNVKNPSPSVINQNSYFEVPALPDGTTALQITAAPTVATSFRMRFYGTAPSTPSDPLSYADAPRGVTLHKASSVSDLGQPLQIISNWPMGVGWLANSTAATLGLSFSAGQFQRQVQVDTRMPVGQFHRRPLVHRSTNGGGPQGGFLAGYLYSNMRSGGEFSTPSRFGVGVSGASANNLIKWYGNWVNFTDGTTGVNNTAYAPPQIRYAGGDFLESLFYNYEDQNPAVKPSGLTSGAFSWSQLGYESPAFDFAPPDGLGSLGWLQHADLSGHGNQPSYIFGNSWVYAPLAGRDCYAGFYNYSNSSYVEYFNRYPAPKPANSSQDRFNLIYDASYMANDALWDRFFLSGLTGAGAVSQSYLDNEKALPNSRLRFRSTLGGDYNALGTPSNRFKLGAAYLLTDGAFNVNSTSVEAWKAVLASRLGLKVNNATANADQAVFSRLLKPGNGSGGFLVPPSNQPAGELAEAYTGARRLSEQEVDLLAREIVAEVRERGPFVSMADFVNRRLAPELSASPFTETALSRTGLRGALQAAIDRSSLQTVAGKPAINGAFYDSGTEGSFYTPAQMRTYVGDPRTDVNVDDSSLQGAVVPRLAMFGERWYYTAAGVPGFLTQADVLQALAPILTVRSDTFRVRAYGEVKNPRTGRIEARAWCEAIVQRYPEPFKKSTDPEDLAWPERPANAGDPAASLGRLFRIIAFRWLTPEEV